MTDSNKLCDKVDIIWKLLMAAISTMCKVKKDLRLIKPRGIKTRGFLKHCTHYAPADYKPSEKPGLDRVKYCNI